MFQADQQKHRRGSANACSTHIDAAGKFDALLAIWRHAHAILTEPPVPDLHEVEEFRIEPLIRELNDFVQGQPLFLEPAMTEAALQNRQRQLRELRSGQRTPIRREIRTRAMELVADRIASMRQAISQGINAAPRQGDRLIERVRSVLQEMRLPNHHREAEHRLVNVLRGIELLEAHRTEVAESALAFLKPQLLDLARTLCTEGVNGFCGELIAEQFQAAVRELEPFFEQQATFARRVARQQDELLSAIEDRREERLQQQSGRSPSLRVTLAGPRESEVIGGQLARNQVREPQELAGLLLERLEHRLRQQLAREYPALAEHGELSQLLLQLPPQQITALYEQEFEEALGEGDTLYEIVEQHGSSAVVQALCQRAEPLCHLSSRDIPQFNVSPLKHSIVRLPRPCGPQDARIRGEIENLFHQHLNCTVLEATGKDQEISILTVLLGWPIAIEEGNRALLEYYCRCEQTGHRPHLTGVLPGSEAGAVLPEYLQLGRTVRETGGASNQICHTT
jgi:hypothetical protein